MYPFPPRWAHLVMCSWEATRIHLSLTQWLKKLTLYTQRRLMLVCAFLLVEKLLCLCVTLHLRDNQSHARLMGLGPSQIVQRTLTLASCLMQVTRAIECVISVRPQTTAISLSLAKLSLRKYPRLRCRIMSPLACVDPRVKECPLIDTVLCRIFSYL